MRLPRPLFLGPCILVAAAIGFGTRGPCDDGRATEPASQCGVLLLRSGQIVQGQILRTGPNYMVRKPTGEMFLPADAVRLEGEDLPDLYRKLREQLPNPATAEHRLTLARWCLKVQMLTQAREELKEALIASPDHEESRQLLSRVDDLLRPAKPVAASPWEAAEPGSKAAVHSEEAEALGGLSREAGQQFIRRIQPMLMNNCAISGCHAAPTTNGLSLHRVRLGAEQQRRTSEKNLASLLAFVSLKTPRSSRLLTTLREPHGRRSRVAFSGPKGREQYAELQKWVLGLAHESGLQRPGPTDLAARETGSSNDAPSETRVAHTAAPDTDGPAPSASAPARTPSQPKTKGSPSGTDVKAEPKPPVDDPFDPGTFNANR